MPTGQKSFKRIEKKYLITEEQYQRLLPVIGDHMIADEHKSKTIFSVYFDTPDNLLIRRSIEKPLYKEKLRFRTYGVPDDNTFTYVEVKKKFKKIVYKRRAAMTYKDAKAFLIDRERPAGYEKQQQIVNEIEWFLKTYDPIAPSMLVSYDRIALYGIDNRDLRITFDNNILWRDCHLSPAEGAWGNKILGSDKYIMEIKIPGAMPLWLAHILSDEKIYPTSFSKVGTAYKMKLQEGDINYG